MCKAMREIRRDFINQGISIGRNEGISIGEERMKHAVMQNAMAMGYSGKDIKRIFDFGTEKRRQE